MEDIRKAAANPATALAYPFDAGELLRTRRKLKRRCWPTAANESKKIAVLGGSTTNDVCDMLELFLLAEGIRPVFYQSEYAKVLGGRYVRQSDAGGLRAGRGLCTRPSATLRRISPHPDDSAEAVEGRLADAAPLFRDVGKPERRIRLPDCAEQL